MRVSVNMPGRKSFMKITKVWVLKWTSDRTGFAKELTPLFAITQIVLKKLTLYTINGIRFFSNEYWINFIIKVISHFPCLLCFNFVF